MKNKKYEINEEKNVSIEEIDINEVKETKNGDEIYSIKNQNKIDSTEKFEKNKKNNMFSSPTVMSISGSDRRNLSQNGEKINEILNIKKKKDIKDKITD